MNEMFMAYHSLLAFLVFISWFSSITIIFIIPDANIGMAARRYIRLGIFNDLTINYDVIFINLYCFAFSATIVAIKTLTIF
ncbi:hypothetical protein JZM10_02790 [Providencia rettgeri]|uniref:hypothetical protein n=1 Tax=Providencia rettgeri TaxID=587 RepID=UPI00197FD8A9|nr:hypothetical protein [Providencia rettgeri]MBN6350393.1 hypothetical protein [Providencia rettgeri]